MDEKTIRHYEENAAGLVVRYGAATEPLRVTFRNTFKAGDRVLDIGSGTGRDLQILLNQGCDAYGAEPSSSMRDTAVKHNVKLAGRMVDAGLPELGKPFGGNFDGITCTAVLMHLPKAEQLDAAMAIRNNLKVNGVLLLSFPVSRTGLDGQDRDEFGRLFTAIDPDETQLLFERIGFALEEKWISEDGLGRVDQQWQVMRFRFKHQMGSRPIDLIEGVMNRDQRTATYKLALFRALAEIATTEFGQARWLGDGSVGIPIHALAEKWIQYYWPLVGSRTFIPQIWGEN
jgi:SAM-dependent methyltransferase